MSVWLALGSAGCQSDDGRDTEAPAAFTISGQAAFGNGSEQARIELDCNYPWQAALVDDEARWVSLSPSSGKAGKSSVMIVVAANSGETRTADILFTSKDAAGVEATETLTVTQSGTTLEVSPGSIDFDYLGGTEIFTVTTDAAAGWRVGIPDGGDWCSATKDGDKISVEVEPNYWGSREATLLITAGIATEEVVVRQAALDKTTYYTDGEVIKLQSAANGAGVDLVVMGDGYVLADMTRTGGKYEQIMREAAGYFFSTYPLSVHKNKFNVWMVVAISNDSGITDIGDRINKDTRFESAWSGMGTTRLTCNEETVEQYALMAAAVAGKTIDKMTVVMPLNMIARSGTSWPRKDGFSFSLVPTGPSFFKSMVIHEACGHGFGRLADEYHLGSRAMTSDVAAQVLDAQASGIYLNIDVACEGDASESLWKGFVGHPKYPMVGAYEGSFQFATGVWRPEEKKSCMDNENIHYFDAQSRWLVVKRIYELADIPYTFEQFLQDDTVPVNPSAN